jgi:hypothetical protein
MDVRSEAAHQPKPNPLRPPPLQQHMQQHEQQPQPTTTPPARTALTTMAATPCSSEAGLPAARAAASQPASPTTFKPKRLSGTLSWQRSAAAAAAGGVSQRPETMVAAARPGGAGGGAAWCTACGGLSFALLNLCSFFKGVDDSVLPREKQIGGSAGSLEPALGPFDSYAPAYRLYGVFRVPSYPLEPPG